MSFNNTN